MSGCWEMRETDLSKLDQSGTKIARKRFPLTGHLGEKIIFLLMDRVLEKFRT